MVNVECGLTFFGEAEMYYFLIETIGHQFFEKSVFYEKVLSIEIDTWSINSAWGPRKSNCSFLLSFCGF